jgi:hypothetical protein
MITLLKYQYLYLFKRLDEFIEAKAILTDIMVNAAANINTR